MTTHHVPDGPGWRSRVVMALCGKHVNPMREHSIYPTCPVCASRLDGLDVDIAMEAREDDNDRAERKEE